jgi:signal transduction histidine kinase
LWRQKGRPFTARTRVCIEHRLTLPALAWAERRRHEQQLSEAAHTARQAVADELHDHAAQLLFGGRLALESLLESGFDARQRDLAVRAHYLCAKGESSVRALIHGGGREPEVADVCTALEDAVREVNRDFGASVDLVVAPSAQRAGS